MKVDWKLFFALWIAGVVAAIAALPYVFSLEKDILEKAPFPPPVLAIISIVQSAVLFGVVILLGLLLAEKTGLKAPVIEAWIKKKRAAFAWKAPVAWGTGVGAVIVLGSFVFYWLGVPIDPTKGLVPVWQGLLASFYGGIGEELLMRLFVMNLIIWLLLKKDAWVMWTAIIAASVLFGLGHLPVTASLAAITPLVITRALVLNGIGGVVFGWLYWKRGLESAIAAHFTADIVIQVIFPLLMLL